MISGAVGRLESDLHRRVICKAERMTNCFRHRNNLRTSVDDTLDFFLVVNQGMNRPKRVRFLGDDHGNCGFSWGERMEVGFEGIRDDVGIGWYERLVRIRGLDEGWGEWNFEVDQLSRVLSNIPLISNPNR